MSTSALAVERLLALGPVIPVLVIDRVEDAVPLAQALVAGGIAVLEVTMRTPAALEALRAMARVPGAVVGAGTVLTPTQLHEVQAAGARFAVSPGLTPALARAATAAAFPLLPGAVTPSEVMAAHDAGFRHLKFFPAVQAGGLPMLRAYAAVFREVMFCPTGGITEATAGDYLSLPNVACVGGSWLAPQALLAQGQWSQITALARAAAGLRG